MGWGGSLVISLAQDLSINLPCLNTHGICEVIAKRSGQLISPWKLLMACLFVLPAQVQAQEEPGRLMLEAGIVAGGIGTN